jgi:hypothetical protein
MEPFALSLSQKDLNMSILSQQPDCWCHKKSHWLLQIVLEVVPLSSILPTTWTSIKSLELEILMGSSCSLDADDEQLVLYGLQSYPLGQHYKENLRVNLKYFYRIHSINYARIIFSANLSIRSLILSIVLYC